MKSPEFKTDDELPPVRQTGREEEGEGEGGGGGGGVWGKGGKGPLN